jgi:hypothetical protein
MACSADDLSADPVIVVINEDEDVGTFGDWRAILAGDASLPMSTRTPP